MSNSFRHQALTVWIVAIVLLSLVPLKWKFFLRTTGRWHGWGHYGVFVITAVLAAYGVRPRTKQLVLGCLVVLLGLVLEGSEVLIYHNRFEWDDLLLDALGVLSGLLLLQLARNRLTVS